MEHEDSTACCSTWHEPASIQGAATAPDTDAICLVEAAGEAQHVEAYDVSQHTGVARAAGADAIRFWAAWFKLHVQHSMW
jgi:hypothetical protein